MGTYLVDQNGDPITSTNPLPTSLTGSYQKKVTLANAVAITDLVVHYYNLITDGSMTEDQIRQYSNFKISLINSHNQIATVSLFTAVRALDLTTPSGSGQLYTEAGNLIATTGRLIMQEKAGGAGVSTNIKAIPALGGVHSSLIVGVSFATVPTSGSLSIVVEMN